MTYSNEHADTQAVELNGAELELAQGGIFGFDDAAAAAVGGAIAIGVGWGVSWVASVGTADGHGDR